MKLKERAEAAIATLMDVSDEMAVLTTYLIEVDTKRWREGIRAFADDFIALAKTIDERVDKDG